jgi:hypothetical protein
MIRISGMHRIVPTKRTYEIPRMTRTLETEGNFNKKLKKKNRSSYSQTAPVFVSLYFQNKKC